MAFGMSQRVAGDAGWSLALNLLGAGLGDRGLRASELRGISEVTRAPQGRSVL